ncbi:MAG: ABC transporter permease [Luteimonas sp.]
MLNRLLIPVWLARMRLGERLGRALYLGLTLAIAVAGWLVLSALASPFLGGDDQDFDYIVVQHERQGLALPLRSAKRIAQMDGVDSVEYMNLLPLVCRPPTGVAALNAWGGAMPEQRLRELGIAEHAVAAWRADPMAVLVGAQLAVRCGWTPGTLVQPRDLYSERPTEIHIVDTYSAESTMREQVAIAHYDYANRMLPVAQRDQVMMIHVRGRDVRQLPALANRIEVAFATSDSPLQARTSAEAEAVLGRFGNVQALLGLVMAAMLACTSLVFISTLAHLTTERRASMAVLQTLGFDHRHMLTALCAELSAILALGTVIGALVGIAAVQFLTPALAHILGGLTTPAWAYRSLLPGLLVLALLSLALPARTILRIRAVDYQSI